MNSPLENINGNLAKEKVDVLSDCLIYLEASKKKFMDYEEIINKLKKENKHLEEVIKPTLKNQESELKQLRKEVEDLVLSKVQAKFEYEKKTKERQSIIEDLNKKLQLYTKKKSKCKKSISTQTIEEEQAEKQTKETQTTEYTERASTSSSEDTLQSHPNNLEVTSSDQQRTSEEEILAEKNEIEDLLRDNFLLSSVPISPVNSISHLDRSEDERSALCDSQMNGFVSSSMVSIANSTILSTNANDPLPEVSLDQIFQFTAIPNILRPINSSPESTSHDEEVNNPGFDQLSRCISDTTTSVLITNPCVSMTTATNDILPIAPLTSQSSGFCHESPPSQSPMQEHMVPSITSIAARSISSAFHQPLDATLEVPPVDTQEASSSLQLIETSPRPFVSCAKRLLNEAPLVPPPKISRISTNDLSSSSYEYSKDLESTLKKIEMLGKDESCYKRLSVADVAHILRFLFTPTFNHNSLEKMRVALETITDIEDILTGKCIDDWMANIVHPSEYKLLDSFMSVDILRERQFIKSAIVPTILKILLKYSSSLKWQKHAVDDKKLDKLLQPYFLPGKCLLANQYCCSLVRVLSVCCSLNNDYRSCLELTRICCSSDKFFQSLLLAFQIAICNPILFSRKYLISGKALILYMNMLSFGLPVDNESDVFINQSIEDQKKQLQEMAAMLSQMVGFHVTCTSEDLYDSYDNVFEQIESNIRTASLIDVSNHKQIWELTFENMVDCYSAISIITLSRGICHEAVFNKLLQRLTNMIELNDLYKSGGLQSKCLQMTNSCEEVFIAVMLSITHIVVAITSRKFVGFEANGYFEDTLTIILDKMTILMNLAIMEEGGHRFSRKVESALLVAVLEFGFLKPKEVHAILSSYAFTSSYFLDCSFNFKKYKHILLPQMTVFSSSAEIIPNVLQYIDKFNPRRPLYPVFFNNSKE